VIWCVKDPAILNEWGRVSGNEARRIQQIRRFEWSTSIPESEPQSLLEALTERCHSLVDLQRFSYLVSPYGPSFPLQDPTITPNYREYRETSPYLFSGCTAGRRYKAVTLHCDTAGLRGPDGPISPLIMFCVADYCTGYKLIVTVILPFDENIDWRNLYDGGAATCMDEQVKMGWVLEGWMAARSKLWEFIDSEAILVGRFLQDELNYLRIIHTKVIDLAILASEALGSYMGPPPPIQDLCKELLGKIIPDRDRKGRICLQDMMATRELVIWCGKNQWALEEWGRLMEAVDRRKVEDCIIVPNTGSESGDRQEDEARRYQHSLIDSTLYFSYTR
jgi:hypothetical protein